MSPHPSPGPSTQISQAHSALSRQKQKPYTIGIAAGAEDAKYQAKYKDLKRKVKEIEADNDKLHFKVLQAKRSIQRMKLERAVLYERLAIVPPSSDIYDRRAYPSVHAGPGVSVPSHTHTVNHPHREINTTGEPERKLVEYARTHDNSRVAPGPDGRLVPAAIPMGPGVAPASHMPEIHSPRRAPGHESLRQLPHLPQLPSVQHLEAPRSHSHARPHGNPRIHHTHAGSSHERTRSHSSSRSHSRHVTAQAYHPGHTHPPQYPENIPPVQHVLSPPMPERERQRRHDIRELAGSHGDSHVHGRHSAPLAQHSHSDTRSSSRIHSHQPMRPDTYMNRDEHRERRRDLEHEWEREPSRDVGHAREMHTHSPPPMHRSRQPIDRGDYQEHHTSSRIREDQGYYRDAPVPGGYPMLSRSGTPGSGSASGDGPSRPDSRTQFYEHDRTRSSYRLRPVNQPNEDVEYTHEAGRSQSRDRGGGGGGNFAVPEQSRPSLDSRKRGRNDMDVDSENDVGDGLVYSSGRMTEDRGSKRYHHRSAENLDDGRMVP